MPSGIPKNGVNKGHFKKGESVSVDTEFKKGIKPWNLGMKMSDEHKAKLSLAHKGQVSHNKGKKVAYKARPSTRGRIPWNLGKKMPEISGENSHLWKGGITPENERIRSSLEYKLWRKACFERDDFTCQKYGVRTGGLVVHHINNFADFPELRTSIENGITLSEKAHKEFHKKYGVMQNSREQLDEFLTNTI